MVPLRRGWCAHMNEAIFSVDHRPLSVAKNGEGCGRAHARYILRESAAVEILGTVQTAAEWGAPMENLSVAKRKDGRLCDKVMVAIPAAIPADERAAFVTDVAAEIVGGHENLAKMAWTAAIHSRGDDAENPHVHMMIRDQNLETGERVWKSTAFKSTERLRAAVATATNRYLEKQSQFVDHRSFARRGIVDRLPTRHVGPGPGNPNAIAWNAAVRSLNSELDLAQRGFDEANARLAELREIEAMQPIAPVLSTSIRPLEPARAAEPVPQRVATLPPTVTPIIVKPVPLPAPPRVATPPPLAISGTVRDVVSSLVALGESGDHRIDPALETPWSDAIQRYDKTRTTSRAAGHGDIGTIPIRELLRDTPRRVAAVADPRIDVNDRLKRLIELVRIVTIEARRFARDRFESLTRSTRKPPPPTPPPLSR